MKWEHLILDKKLGTTKKNNSKNNFSF